MPYYFGHETAVEFWSRYGSPYSGLPTLSRTVPPERKAPSNRAARALADGPFVAYRKPLHALVPTAADRRQSPNIISHVWKGFAISKAFHCAEETRIYVASPEATFLQTATDRSLLECVAYGFELCGSYATSPDGNGFRTRGQVSTPQRLRAFLARAHGLDGRSAASRAAAFVLDGSASPMETFVVMQLSLPPRYGGYGLPRPLLNCRLDVTATGLRYVGLHRPGNTGKPERPSKPVESMPIPSIEGNFRVPDLYWPDYRVAVEYDSTLYHTGSSRIARDSRKRNLLASANVTVITVTSEQAHDFDQMEKIALQIGKLLNRPIRREHRGLTPQRRCLRNALLRSAQHANQWPYEAL